MNSSVFWLLHNNGSLIAPRVQMKLQSQEQGWTQKLCRNMLKAGSSSNPISSLQHHFWHAKGCESHHGYWAQRKPKDCYLYQTFRDCFSSPTLCSAVPTAPARCSAANEEALSLEDSLSRKSAQLPFVPMKTWRRGGGGEVCFNFNSISCFWILPEKLIAKPTCEPMDQTDRSLGFSFSLDGWKED